jgi:hypothetical protein
LFTKFFFMKRMALATMIFALFFMLYGCEPGSSLTISDRPNPPTYVRPISPGDGYVWLDGDWYWSDGRYNWREGYWSRPRGHRVWHSGSWQQRGNGWSWRRGRWH